MRLPKSRRPLADGRGRSSYPHPRVRGIGDVRPAPVSDKFGGVQTTSSDFGQSSRTSHLAARSESTGIWRSAKMGTPTARASGVRPRTATELCPVRPGQSSPLRLRAARLAAKTTRRIQSDGRQNGRHRGDRIAVENRPTGYKTSTLRQKPLRHAWSCPPLILAQRPGPEPQDYASGQLKTVPVVHNSGFDCIYDYCIY